MESFVTFPPAIERTVDAVYPPWRQLLANELARIVHPFYFAFVSLELAFLLWFYYSGASMRLRRALELRVRNPLLTALCYIAILFTGLSLAMLPMSFFGSYHLSHSFGLSSETVGRWFRDWAVSLALGAGVAAIVGSLFLRAIARWRTWPLIASIAAAILLVIGSVIYPVFITPLFNKFTPLPASPLTRAILKLAAQQGLDTSVVYEYNMSLQTNEANAYVAGLGKTERIAVGDTLLHSIREDEVLYVMAHEIGHYKLGHLWLGTLEAWLAVVAAIALIAALGGRIASRDKRLSRDLSDPAAAPLVAALLVAFAVVTAPLTNQLSRNIERAADTFAAQHTRLGDAGVRAEARIASLDLVPLHPSRLAVWYFYTHPPTDERILDAARGANLAR
jgi:Zn-dependent protease with chaperone function